MPLGGWLLLRLSSPRLHSRILLLFVSLWAGCRGSALFVLRARKKGGTEKDAQQLQTMMAKGVGVVDTVVSGSVEYCLSCLMRLLPLSEREVFAQENGTTGENDTK
ncbi:uncharacterized protein J3D65DRAFT_638453 [Phyllosticta citribraziliensis]|uniref:Uncharacterized protein n=1 Tax=Phyllosticta citribraziliensis TaxID=989973 RepID=A0ABR1LAM6_9PEZI